MMSNTVGYSLVEQDTGETWVDGSTIYQKTILGSSLTGIDASYTVIDFDGASTNPLPKGIIRLSSGHFGTVTGGSEVQYYTVKYIKTDLFA